MISLLLLLWTICSAAPIAPRPAASRHADRHARCAALRIVCIGYRNAPLLLPTAKARTLCVYLVLSLIECVSQARIPALPFRQNLPQTGIVALPFRHSFVSYISMMTTKHKYRVRQAITFGRKSGCSLDIYIVNVARYFKYHKKPITLYIF